MMDYEVRKNLQVLATDNSFFIRYFLHWSTQNCAIILPTSTLRRTKIYFYYWIFIGGSSSTVFLVDRGLLIDRSSRWVWIWGEGTRVMRALVHLHIQTLATTLARLWDESHSRANDDPRWPLYDALLLLHHRSNTPIDRVNGFECFSSLPSPFHLEKLTLETLRFLSSSSGSTLFRNFTKENVSIGERRFVYTLLFLSFFCFLTARRMVNSPSNFPSQ